MVDSVLEFEATRRRGPFELDALFTSDGAGVTVLFGRSGSGKTTIADAVAGLVRPDRGRIRVGGTTVFDSAAGIDVPVHRRGFGYVFQDGRLFPHMTVRSNLTYGMRRVERPRIRFDQVVDLLEIRDLLGRRPHTLSGGEKQRVATGRALLTDPRLLVMDEPLSSLDPGLRFDVLPFFARLPRELGVPILYVSHSVDEILALADRLVLVDGGRVVAQGSVEDLMSDLGLRPHTGRYEAGSVIQARVAEHDSDYGLTVLEFAGGRLRIPLARHDVGSAVRLRIHARDVALSLEPPARSSFQNVIRATVASVSRADDTFVDVLLDAGRPLWARVTHRSREALGIEPGLRVHALIKSVAITRGQAAPL